MLIIPSLPLREKCANYQLSCPRVLVDIIPGRYYNNKDILHIGKAGKQDVYEMVF